MSCVPLAQSLLCAYIQTARTRPRKSPLFGVFVLIIGGNLNSVVSMLLNHISIGEILSRKFLPISRMGI